MKQKKLQEYFNLLIKLAITMVVSVLTFFLAALFIEKQWPMNGMLVLASTVTGVVLGFTGMYYQLKKFF